VLLVEMTKLGGRCRRVGATTGTPCIVPRILDGGPPFSRVAVVVVVAVVAAMMIQHPSVLLFVVARTKGGIPGREGL